ncbi:MAG: TIGR02444 family protein [Rhodospirillaceae bacterium]|nr:TIGR02444 family protein [Rhodospirillaceae bacterium]
MKYFWVLIIISKSFSKFSVEIYSNNKIENYCLDLQSKFDVDVNILLFAIWAAKEKNIIISLSDFENLHSATTDWQLKIVKKIRSMRMNLKKINNQEFNEVYNELKKLEILAEFIEHEIILSFFFTNGERNKSRKFVKDICVSNLNTYFKFLHIDQFDQNNFLDLIFKKI